MTELIVPMTSSPTEAVTSVVPTNQASLTPAELNARVAELARLPSLEYGACRLNEAAALGFSRVHVLDKEVKRLRDENEAQHRANRSGPFKPVEPWPEPVDGAALLDELHATILRFCILPEHSWSWSWS